jgi:hypothetical protein
MFPERFGMFTKTRERSQKARFLCPGFPAKLPFGKNLKMKNFYDFSFWKNGQHIFRISNKSSTSSINRDVLA